MRKKGNILYLYSEAMGYTIAVIKEIIRNGYDVHLVHWGNKKKTPYKIPNLSNLYLYNRAGLSLNKLENLVTKIAPDLIVVSGWMDKAYLLLARKFIKKGVPIVAGFDSQWEGSFRQLVATLLGKIGFFKSFFSHAWVPGPCQFEYARRIGFKKNEIIFDLLSADLYLWNKIYKLCKKNKLIKYPHRFLYVGRFSKEKGLDTLIKAWSLLGKNKKDWDLKLVGSGPLFVQLKRTKGIIVEEFIQPDNLIYEALGSGCFILPSSYEPWGVVVHEFASSGLPLIISDVVGAGKTFLIHGLNGFKFKAKDPADLAKKMELIIDMDDKRLYRMGFESHNLAQRITPSSAASNLLSIIR